MKIYKKQLITSLILILLGNIFLFNAFANSTDIAVFFSMPYQSIGSDLISAFKWTFTATALYFYITSFLILKIVVIDYFSIEKN